MSEIYTPGSALVVVAHPDDIELSCGGSLALWARAGAEITYVLCTSGESGVDDPQIGRAEAMAIRETEQQAAADVVGAREVIFLRERDGLLQATLDLREKLVRIIRRVRPEVVISGDPSVLRFGPSLLNHPDHRAAALAVLEAAWPAAGQRNLYPDMDADEELALHRPRKFFFTGWIQPGANLFVDISETLAAKADALREHRSQTRGGDPEPLVRHQAQRNAAGQEMELAECFLVTTLVDDERWERTRGDRSVEMTPLE